MEKIGDVETWIQLLTKWMLPGLPGDRRSVGSASCQAGHGQSFSRISVCWVGEKCWKKDIESTANASPNVSPLFREYDWHIWHVFKTNNARTHTWHLSYCWCSCIHFVSAKEQQSELRAAEASRRLGALDLRTSAAGSPGSPSMALLGFATCSSLANIELFTWQCGTGILLHTIMVFFFKFVMFWQVLTLPQF